MKSTGCSQCGGIILADTEEWENPLCHECWIPLTRLDILKLQSQLAIAKEALEWIVPKIHQAYHDGDLKGCLKSCCSAYCEALEKIK